jgi:uncharacterized protein (DUF885 family)
MKTSSCAAVLLIACIVAVPCSWSASASPRNSQDAGNGGGRAVEAPGSGELDTTRSEMRGLIERFIADRGGLNRFYIVEASAARQAVLKKFYTDWLATIARLNFDSMSQDGKVDYLLFRNYLDHELRQLDTRSKAYAEIAPLLPFSPSMTGLEDARRRMEKIDSAKTAAFLTELSKQVEEARKKLEAVMKTADPKATSPPVKKAVANRAAVALGNLRNTLKGWYTFYNGYDPLFTWWNETPYKSLDGALNEYAVYLREKVVGLKPGDNTAIVGDPIGREALMSELAYEMIPYTPEELIAIANREMAWCDAEMIKASRELGYGDDWKKALEHVKTLYVEPGKQPDLIRELALEAIEYVEKNNLVTVPQLARETWRMEMMTPARQLVSPFFLGGETIQISYPTNSMSHEQKMMSMRGNNPHFSRATVFHELIPGHHLQGFMAARYRSYRNLFSTPFWTEGWALYWELLLWDRNFAKSPANKIGMLFWRMHRCARIIFSLSFHLEQMTPDQCIELLVNRVGHERDNATAEVRRSFAGDYGPLYQCAYLLGGMQIRALRKELVDSGKMSDREFHDAVLKQNRIPIEMVRAGLKGQALTRDFKSSWKGF